MIKCGLVAKFLNPKIRKILRLEEVKKKRIIMRKIKEKDRREKKIREEEEEVMRIIRILRSSGAEQNRKISW